MILMTRYEAEAVDDVRRATFGWLYMTPRRVARQAGDFAAKVGAAQNLSESRLALTIPPRAKGVRGTSVCRTPVPRMMLSSMSTPYSDTGHN